ncbi:MAG: hypothetical protein M2R45_02929 [Verrucomicrobia subdivision 3 bacterium]|nr:hypothetical protein [Limisphaerales bacterium]MCS1415350.1 hypothetical protein [Limisphaerales bacterium]
MPVLIAEGSESALQPGRILNYHDQSDKNRYACSLYLSLLNKMGVTLLSFGDIDHRLQWIQCSEISPPRIQRDVELRVLGLR